jgi:Carboxypeptidase regulatory-like domain
MSRLKYLNIFFGLTLLIAGFNFSIKGQEEDCVYGFKIYARDETGKVVENVKLEVVGVSEKDKPPSNVNSYVDKSGVYNIHGSGGMTVKGDFLLKISAKGFEPYERQFNFPFCEIQSFELKLRPVGSTAKADFERLFTVHGKVFDEDMKPFGNANVEAKSSDDRVYQTNSNAYGYYTFDLPKGVTTIRITDSKIPDVVFDNYKVEKNYSVLNVPVCLKCKQKEPKN